MKVEKHFRENEGEMLKIQMFNFQFFIWKRRSAFFEDIMVLKIIFKNNIRMFFWVVFLRNRKNFSNSQFFW